VLSLILPQSSAAPAHLLSFPTRRSSDLSHRRAAAGGPSFPRDPRAGIPEARGARDPAPGRARPDGRHRGRDERLERAVARAGGRSEEHTSELQSLAYLVCRLLLEKKKTR